MKFTSYNPEGFYDEMFVSMGQPRPSASLLMQKIQALPDREFERRQQAAEGALMAKGVTFSVYGDEAGIERIFPFDAVPRLIESADWERIERGLRQRVIALNCFINDIYHDQKIIKDAVVPGELKTPNHVGAHAPETDHCDLHVRKVATFREGSRIR